MRLRTFQFYMSDCAQLICNNVANGFGGSLIEIRLSDLYKPEPTESAEEIKDRIFSGLRELGEDDGCI